MIALRNLRAALARRAFGHQRAAPNLWRELEDLTPQAQAELLRVLQQVEQELTAERRTLRLPGGGRVRL